MHPPEVVELILLLGKVPTVLSYLRMVRGALLKVFGEREESLVAFKIRQSAPESLLQSRTGLQL
jgi:hypothetical protein